MTRQLRMTTWPGSVVPLPEVLVEPIEVARLDSGTWFVCTDSKPASKPLPVDFYLREPQEVPPNWNDTGDTGFQLEDLAGFVREWGRFSDPRERDLEPSDDVDRYRAMSAKTAGWLADGFDTLRSGREQALVELGIVPAKAIKPGGGLAHALNWLSIVSQASDRLVHPVEVVDRLWRAQAIGRDVQDYLVGKDASIDPGAIDDINYALTPMSVRIIQEKERALSAYTVMALQIVNDLVDRAETRTCRNEKCGRVFTRQRGRSQYGEHRTKGVQFCSKSCALAQTQRERRRRLKAEKVQSNG